MNKQEKTELSRPNLTHNVAALALVQVLGYILPFITLPYVTRTLGPEVWGKVAFVSGFVGYFGLIIGWGFGISAVRKIAACRDDSESYSRILFAGWGAQVIIFVFCFLLYFIIINTFAFFKQDYEYYLWGGGSLVASIVFPGWFLNGMERIKELATVQILIRLLSVPMTFLLVRDVADGYMLLVIAFLTSVTAGVATLVWCKANLPIQWKLPSFKDIKSEILEGSTIFFSTLSISIYISLIPTVLGVLSGHTSLAYFTLADRIKTVVQGGLSPLSQALFPRLSSLFASDQQSARRLLKKSSIIMVGLAFFGSLSVWVSADLIVSLLGGKNFSESVLVLRWLSFVPFVVVLSNIFGIQIMMPLQMKREFNMVLFSASALSLTIMYPLIISYGAAGAAANILLVELFVTSAMAIVLWKKNFFVKVVKK